MASASPRRSGDPSSPSSPLLPSPTSPGAAAAAASAGAGPLGRLTGLRGAARFIRRTGSRRLMREPSVAVRETAAEHLEERQTDWAYSKPVVVLDVLWNLAFVAVAAAVLAASLEEKPALPLRVWLAGYVLQCLLHVLCVAVEYKRRRREARAGSDQEATGDGDFKLIIVKHLESGNTMFSFIWWIVGFYWVSAGGQALSQDAPQLYPECTLLVQVFRAQKKNKSNLVDARYNTRHSDITKHLPEAFPHDDVRHPPCSIVWSSLSRE